MTRSTYAADLINTQVRLPRDLRDRLRERADADRRSVNATIIVLLEQALGGEAEREQAEEAEELEAAS